MFKFLCWSLIIGLLIATVSAKINVRALADVISQKMSDLIDEILNLPESLEKQEFLVTSQALQHEIEQLNSVSSPSLVDLYLIEPQLEQLTQEVEDLKGTPLHNNDFKSFVRTSVNPAVATTCDKVDESKTQIESYPPEQCLGYKLLPGLTDCQKLCAALKLQTNNDQINYSPQLRRCESINGVWKLLSSTKLDKATLDQACNDIKAIGSDIDKFPIAQCFKEPVSKDQKILEAICSRLQQDYDHINEVTLHTKYDDVVSKTKELNQKWIDFKAAEIAKPYSPVPVVSTCVPTRTDVEKGGEKFFENLLNPTSNTDFVKRLSLENLASIGYNTTFMNELFNAYQKFIELIKFDKPKKCDLEDAYTDIISSFDANLSSQNGFANVFTDESYRKSPLFADFFQLYDDCLKNLFAVVNDTSLAKNFFSGKSGILASNLIYEVLNIQKKLFNA